MGSNSVSLSFPGFGSRSIARTSFNQNSKSLDAATIFYAALAAYATFKIVSCLSTPSSERIERVISSDQSAKSSFDYLSQDSQPTEKKNSTKVSEKTSAPSKNSGVPLEKSVTDIGKRLSQVALQRFSPNEVNSFSTVSTCSSASTAQSIQQQFVMIRVVEGSDTSSTRS